MAKKIYLTFLIFSFVWLMFIFLTPYFYVREGFLHNIAEYSYRFYNITCHQIDNRSFHLFGEKLAVCARCTSVYSGFTFGVLLYPIFMKINSFKLPPLWLLIIPFILILLDSLLDLFNIYKNTFFTRTITGGLMGLVLPFFLIPGFNNFFNEVCTFAKYHLRK